MVRKRRICSNACGVLQIVKLYLNPQTFLSRVGWGSENPIGGGGGVEAGAVQWQGVLGGDSRRPDACFVMDNSQLLISLYCSLTARNLKALSSSGF